MKKNMKCKKIEFKLETESKIILFKILKKRKILPSGLWSAPWSRLYGQHLGLVFMVSNLVSSLWSAHWSRLYGQQLGLVFMVSNLVSSLWSATWSPLYG